MQKVFKLQLFCAQRQIAAFSSYSYRHYTDTALGSPSPKKRPLRSDFMRFSTYLHFPHVTGHCKLVLTQISDTWPGSKPWKNELLSQYAEMSDSNATGSSHVVDMVRCAAWLLFKQLFHSLIWKQWRVRPKGRCNWWQFNYTPTLTHFYCHWCIKKPIFK